MHTDFGYMTEDSWHWQEPETAWKGVGIYHVTLTVPSRQPLLGELIIPDNDPKQAYVDLLPLGEKIKSCIRLIPELHPEIQIIGIRMMPDHVHFILYVRQTMPVSIKTVIRGFWQGARKEGRLFTLSICPNTIRDNEQRLFPIFTEVPFIRPMSRRGQLDAMMQYIKLNPQRLATKRLKPEYFYVQEGIEINGRIYSAVGNSKILMEAQRTPVHVRHTMVDEAEHGDDKRLRDYKDSCLQAAQNGAVMVSPFINQYEHEVLDHLIQDKRPVIYIADNGFRDYYKPSAHLFDAVDAGNMLILSPWEYDHQQKHVSRAKCVEMNNIAEEICRL